MKITKYAIFVNGQNDKKEIAEMILLLTKNRVQRNQIRIYDISDDNQIKLYFKQNNYTYPVLFLWGNIYGSLNYVKEQATEGYLQLALMNNPNKRGKKKGNTQSDYEFNPVVEEEQIEEPPFENKKIIPKQKPLPKKQKKEKKKKTKESQEIIKENEMKEEQPVIVEVIETIEPEITDPLEELKNEIPIENQSDQSDEKENEIQNEIQIQKEENKESKEKEDSFEEDLLKITESIHEIENQEEENEIKIMEKESKVIQQTVEKVVQQSLLDIDIIDVTEIPNENTKEMIIIEDYDCSEQIENEQYFELNVPQLDTLNINDKWLNACEWVLRVLNPMKPNAIEEDPTYLKKNEEDIDYYVTRTNWYWRHQIRIIRFTNECFYRLDEEYRIREKFMYEDVSEIIQTDYDHVVIKFNQHSQTQYLQCRLCSHFIKTLSSHINKDSCILKLL